jgi:hypothetical protein
MSNEPDLDKMAKDLKKSIDNNAQDSPRLNIDPDTQKMAVVGDPNNTKPANKPYHLVFCYPESALSEEDKARMVKVDNDYFAGVEYEAVRVKPLHRTKVAMLLTKILVDLKVVTKDGYTSDTVNSISGQLLLEHFDDIAQLAHLILDVPDEQLAYLNGGCLFEFFTTILDNEPNIMQEGSNFLSYSELQAKMQSQKK